MSQNDYTIANQSAPDFRSDLNDALQALASLSSGSTAPSTTYANMLWYDTGNNILKMRSEADDDWIDIGTLNQSTNEFEVAGLTTLSEATWETGTSTTESLVSPAKVKAAIDALSPESGLSDIVVGFGSGTTDFTGLSGVSKVFISASANSSSFNAITESVSYQLSTDNGSTFGTAVTMNQNSKTSSSFNDPVGVSASRIIDMSTGGNDAIRINGDYVSCFVVEYV